MPTFSRTIILCSMALAALAVPQGSSADARDAIKPDPSQVAPGGSVEVTLSCSPSTPTGMIGSDPALNIGSGEVALTNGYTSVVLTVPKDAPKGQYMIYGYCENDPKAESISPSVESTLTIV
ncbi:hypothetical protein [Spongiactinospora sp. 9N601]|uniref:hypothetical protein n=1 Tax=Spongiactinospora sp. 9N601 TaxID=3375149 RepID=UPI003796C90D